MCTTENNCPESFYSKVLNDVNSRHSYFVVIELKADTELIPIIVETGELFYFLSKHKSYTKEQYVNTLKSSLINKIPLYLGDIRYKDSLRYHELGACDNIKEIAKKGKEAFVGFYFNNKVLKKPVSDDELYCIVYHLFKWYIPARIDDESGYLKID
ncbi:MAG: hypothetical protein J4G05_09015 [Chlorobi bacterium]|nr:hypothetical protein [Chlorobiota bacterium]